MLFQIYFSIIMKNAPKMDKMLATKPNIPNEKGAYFYSTLNYPLETLDLQFLIFVDKY